MLQIASPVTAVWVAQYKVIELPEKVLPLQLSLLVRMDSQSQK